MRWWVSFAGPWFLTGARLIKPTLEISYFARKKRHNLRLKPWLPGWRRRRAIKVKEEKLRSHVYSQPGIILLLLSQYISRVRTNFIQKPPKSPPLSASAEKKLLYTIYNNNTNVGYNQLWLHRGWERHAAAANFSALLGALTRGNGSCWRSRVSSPLTYLFICLHSSQLKSHSGRRKEKIFKSHTHSALHRHSRSLCLIDFITQVVPSTRWNFPACISDAPTFIAHSRSSIGLWV